MTTLPANQRHRKHRAAKPARLGPAAAPRRQRLRAGLRQVWDRLLPAVAAIVSRVPESLADADYTRRAASLGLVAVTNLALLSIFLSVAQPHAGATAVREIQAVLIAGHELQPAAPPKLVKPDADIIPAPDIQIAEETAPAAITQIDSASMALVLAPRPDPLHRNEPFQLPSLQKTAGLTSIVLRILVMPDGSVADAQITSSSGHADVDATAIAFVKANWRYLPATLQGRTLQYWTTVIVPIRAA